MDRHLDLPERGDQPDLLWPQDGATLDDDRPRVDVLATHPHVRPLGGRSDPHSIAEALDVFLRVDGIRAMRDRRARHDPDGLPGQKRAVEHGAGWQLGDDGQVTRPGGGKVRAGDGVPVHRGVVGRGHVEGRPHVLGDDPAEGAAQREELEGRDVADLGEDPILAVLHRDHGVIIRSRGLPALEPIELPSVSLREHRTGPGTFARRVGPFP